MVVWCQVLNLANIFVASIINYKYELAKLSQPSVNSIKVSVLLVRKGKSPIFQLFPYLLQKLPIFALFLFLFLWVFLFFDWKRFLTAGINEFSYIACVPFRYFLNLPIRSRFALFRFKMIFFLIQPYLHCNGVQRFAHVPHFAHKVGILMILKHFDDRWEFFSDLVHILVYFFDNFF